MSLNKPKRNRSALRRRTFLVSMTSVAPRLSREDKTPTVHRLPQDAILDATGLFHVNGAEPEDGATLKVLVRILRRRRRIVVATIVSLSATVAVVVNNLTPLYTATSAVVIKPRESRVVDVQSVLEGVPQDEEFLQTQVNLLGVQRWRRT